VTGTVVDYDTNSPVSGASVGLAPWTAGATPAPEATTNASGQFSFSAAAGKYLLVVSGSNTAVLHQMVTIAAPTTAITALPEQNVGSMPAGFTPNAAQTSGNLRLINLSGTAATKYNISACVTAFNAGRSSNSLSQVSTDEYLTEDGIADVQQLYTNAANFPDDAVSNGVVPYASFAYGTDTPTQSGEACSAWTNTFNFNESQSGATIYAAATNPSYVWYGIGFDTTDMYASSGGPEGFGTQIWASDPR
jgi:hypothetical protein